MSEITLYTAPTANGWKASIALEELGIDYDVEYLHFDKNEQKTPDFLKLNPNGRIPVIVDHDHDDFVLAESGAILLYLAERSGKLWPTDSRLRHKAMQWLMFQMSAIGPMLGQAMFFQRIAAPKGIVDEYAIERYVTESKRLLGVLNDALRDQEYLCGAYSMVDIATFPWARRVSVGQRRYLGPHPPDRLAGACRSPRGRTARPVRPRGQATLRLQRRRTESRGSA